ncbi:MAG: ABC transporter substrate-binding protein [Candidatus Hodarchaeota archaeon]
MEQLTKRILAIVLIAVIGVGVGITVWIFVSPYNWSYRDCPGAPNDITSDQIIRFGVLGGMTDIQGKGEWEGAWLAAKHINENGGVVVGGKQYYVGITNEDTQESYTSLDITAGVSAAQRIINYKNVQYLIGGFRSESVLAYQEVIMDNKIIFMSTGVATNVFTMNVRGFAPGDYPDEGLTGYPGSNYDRYKYFFRVTPINSTALGGEILGMVAGLIKGINATVPQNITKIAIIREDLTWTIGLAAAIINKLPLVAGAIGYPGITIVDDIAYPITVAAATFTTYLNTLNSSGVQILIPVISAQGGQYMTQAYAALKPNYTIIGIDVQSQLESYWGQTNGDCAFETIMQTVVRTNRTSKTIDMWDEYVAEWGDSPLYTATAGYDALNQLIWAINGTQSFDTDTIIQKLETITTANPLESVGSVFAYTDNHDVQEGWPHGLALFTQWLPGNVKQIVKSPFTYWPGPPGRIGKLYPDDLIGVGDYLLPTWPGWAFNS